MKDAKILWHGTPAVVEAARIEPRVAYLEAVWMSGTPEIAALYAGPEGVVHGYALTPGTRLLSTVSYMGAAPRYPSPAEWEHVREWLCEIGRIDMEAMECLDPFKIEHGFQPPLGRAGQPSWSALFNDLSEVMSVGEDLLRVLGYDGIIQAERFELALGDRSAVIAKNADPIYRCLAERIAARRIWPSPSVGLLDASKLVHACTLPSREMVQMQMSHNPLPTTSTEFLEAWACPPVIERAEISAAMPRG